MELRTKLKDQKEETVALIRLEPELIGMELNDDFKETDQKLFITDYNKDPAVFNSSGNAHNVLVKVIGVKDGHKLDGLAKYLLERRKAALIVYQRHDIFLLPSQAFRNGDKTNPLVCLCPTILLKDRSAFPVEVSAETSVKSTDSAASAPAVTASVASNGNQVKQPPASAPVAAKSSSSGPGRPYVASAPGSSVGFNFLASLAQQMTDSNKIRVESSKKSDLELREKSYRESLAKRIESEALKFQVDSLLMEQRLEPMNKDMRTCIHSLIEEYPDLQSASIGDFDDRAVVIFRRGHTPAGVDLAAMTKITKVGGVVVSRVGKQHHSDAVKSAKDGIVGGYDLASNLIEVNEVKRDRRTLEEVQEEMKRRKKEEASGGN